MIGIATFARTTRLFTIVLAAVACATVAAHAQQSTVPLAPPHIPGSDASGFGNTNPRDPDQSRMLKDMTRERNELRQKQIIDDTQHLLDLAKQLKDAVDKSSKDQLSLNVVNTATEIEKLAKVVKEKMRDGQ
jgi:Spy/CpxP family protein refolding chaperone